MTEKHDLESLRALHADLDVRLENERRRPVPDELAISELKRQKLRIKDRIAEKQTGV